MPPFWRQVATGHMPLQVSENLKQPSCHKRRQAAATADISVVSWLAKALAAVSLVGSFRSTSFQLADVMGNALLTGNHSTSGCRFLVSAVPRSLSEFGKPPIDLSSGGHQRLVTYLPADVGIGSQCNVPHFACDYARI